MSLEDAAHFETSLPVIDASWDWVGYYPDSFPDGVDTIVHVLDGVATNRSPNHEASRSLEISMDCSVSHNIGGRINLLLEYPLRDIAITSR